MKKVLFIPLLLFAFWLRVDGLFGPALHADEALFATWSRQIHTLRDPFLIHETADKPPLLFYLQATLYNLLPAAPFTARLPNLIASMALLPLTAIWTKRLYPLSPHLGRVTMAVLALSPLAMHYSASGFTDPLMLTLCLTAALTAHRRPSLSGLLFGLAIATKYQAILWLPLILLSPFIETNTQPGRHTLAMRPWLISFGSTLLVLIGWLFISFSETGFGRTGDAQLLAQLRPITSWELLPRFLAWRLYIPLPIAILWGSFGKCTADRLLALFLLAYCTLLWLCAFPIYGRYLLLITPVLVIGIGRIIDLLPYRLFFTTSLLSLLLIFNIQPFFPSSTSNPSLLQLPPFPPDAVLYDHYYSWLLREKLYDTYTYIAWIPHPNALITDLAAHYDKTTPRYLILPTQYTASKNLCEPSRPLRLCGHKHPTLPIAHASPFIRRLNAAGYTLQTSHTTDTITLYKITK